MQLTVLVENTGEKFAGREVVQVYATLPQSGMTKEYQRLIGFAKTDLLQPGESETISIQIHQKQLK